MKKQLFLSLILSTLYFTVFSQNKNNEGNYSEILNDPYTIPNFEIMVSPIWIGYSQQNMMTLGWGIGTELSLGKKFLFNGNYNSTYTKNFINYNYPENFSSTRKPINYKYTHKNHSAYSLSQDLKSYYSIQLGIGFIFNDKVRESKDKITLHSNQTRIGTSNIINEEVTYVNTKMRRRWSIRCGYQQTKDLIDLYNLTDMINENNYFIDDEGNQLLGDGIKYSDVEYNQNADPIYGRTDYTKAEQTYGDHRGWISNITSQIVNIGISREVIRNIIIDVDNFGKRGNQQINKLYLDLLFADIDVDKIVFFNSNPEGYIDGEEMGTELKEYDIVGTGSHKLEINNFGFRFGFESRGISPTKILPWAQQNEITRYVNLGYKTEIGIQPGIKGKGFYINLGLFLSFNNRF